MQIHSTHDSLRGTISLVSFGALEGVAGFRGVVGSVSDPKVQSVGGAAEVDNFGVRVGLKVGFVRGLRVVVEIGDTVGAIRGA